MDVLWPVRSIQLGKGVAGTGEIIEDLVKSGELFVLRYIADDSKSEYIYFSSFDNKNKSIIAILRKYKLNKFVRDVKNGELLIMH